MKIVGVALETKAYRNTDETKIDLYGRSAFNRYYYATFLITREMLENLNSRWKRTPHAEIPNLLEKGCVNSVKKQLKRNVQSNLISTGDMERTKQSIQIATLGLANLLRDAYLVRLNADYEPEMKLHKDGKILMLGTCKLNSASTWPNRASSYCKSINKVWVEVGLGKS